MALTDHPQLGHEPNSGDDGQSMAHQAADEHDQDDVQGYGMMYADTEFASAPTDEQAQPQPSKETLSYDAAQLSRDLEEAKAQIAADSQKNSYQQTAQLTDTQPLPQYQQYTQPETNPFIETVAPPKKKRWLRIGVPIVAAAASLGVAGLGIAKVAGSPTPEAAITTTVGPPTSAASEQVSNTAVPTLEATENHDTMNPGEVVAGEATLQAVRPNGEKISVPKLRDPATNSSDAVVASFLGLTDCWGTTHDQKCLDAISTDPSVQKKITSVLNHVEDNVLTNNGMDEAPKTFQVASFNDPDNPAKFEMREMKGGGHRVELPDGTIRVNPYISGSGSNEPWHSPVVEAADYTFSYELISKDFFLEIKDGADGEPTVTNMYWSLERS